jgi:hypothetical protein
MRHDRKDYDQLKEKYKPFFDQLPFGFECGPGWYGLLAKLTEDIHAVIKEKGLKDCRAEQVKEKFGTLRFYISSGVDEIFDLIEEAEEKSETTCEECGQPGELGAKGYWYSVRCKNCER